MKHFLTVSPPFVREKLCFCCRFFQKEQLRHCGQNNQDNDKAKKLSPDSPPKCHGGLKTRFNPFTWTNFDFSFSLGA